MKKPKKHPHYWKLKAAFLQRQQTVAIADAAVEKAMRDAGLDPAKDYMMNDSDETITPKP